MSMQDDPREHAEGAIEYIQDHLGVMRNSFEAAFPGQRLVGCVYITGFGEHRESWSAVAHTKMEDGDIPDALYQWANAFGDYSRGSSDEPEDDSTWLPSDT